MKKIAIGGGQGFWGDSPDAAVDLIRNGNIQYLACDYLAELTMSIMARQRIKDPSKGYAPDFVTRILGTEAKTAKDRNIRILTNAGGMNIRGCVDAIESLAKEQNLAGYKIGFVTGDDASEAIKKLRADGFELKNFDDPEADFDEVVGDGIINANAYIGHEKLQECIAGGADVVITGRAADSALFLAPFAHEFGWADDDWDNLARGIMAGHLLECGGQGSGGNYMYDWRAVPDMDRLGFPIAEISEDSFEITKTATSGGCITEQCVKEQFLYEVHDPANYVTPDVTVDVSRATLTQNGKDRVTVGGIKGKPRPEMLKTGIGYHAGWKVASMLSFAWPDAYEKAKYCGEMIMKKMARLGMRVEDVHISYIGLNSLHLDVADMSPEALERLNECVLRIAVFSRDKAQVAKIIPEISPMQLNGPPGASFFGGRAHVQEVIGLWPTLIPRDALNIEAHIREVR